PRAPGSYLVFFNWNKSNLTSEAMEIVQTVATSAKAGPYKSISATGHADTSGNAKYNMGLSQRRAKAVRAALAKMGVGGDTISTAGKGETEPLVPTGDGVREPQNRRVEIVIDK
ncbi:MAG: OmpA family protein, partial [Rhodospirillales bacterium]|nr:OmpA family protein [Rhodospirillales bacterium]